MIRFYERRDGALIENCEFVPHSLIVVTNPDTKEIADLSEKFSFEKDFITDALDIEERARFEVEGDTLLIILKVPHKNEDKDRKIPFSTVSLGIIVGKEYVLLVSRVPIPFIERMIEKKVFSPKKKTRLVFLVFFRNSEVFLKSLEEINFTLNQIEERLHESTRNVELERLMQLEKSLVYFSTSLRTNQVMIERLLRSPLLVKYEEDTDLLDDTLVELSQAIEMTNIYSNILSSMMDAYASVISNNLNIVLKILTVVTILMQVPTIITSYYGMNIPLPLQDTPYTFLLIIVWVAIVSVVIVYLFRYKGWM
ncbi:MAG: magnesium transporter CorA family protein [Methanomicrobiales archaeon]|nr:magnesium transporter CorA family protein [Methanomicrobiales archaeon]